MAGAVWLVPGAFRLSNRMHPVVANGSITVRIPVLRTLRCPYLSIESSTSTLYGVLLLRTGTLIELVKACLSSFNLLRSRYTLYSVVFLIWMRSSGQWTHKHCVPESWLTCMPSVMEGVCRTGKSDYPNIPHCRHHTGIVMNSVVSLS